METLTFALAAVSAVCSSCISLLYAYIAYKKSKEPPKDEIWETATKIICSKDADEKTADDFALLYESLKLFKDKNYTKDDILSLEYTVRENNKNKSQAQQTE